MNGGLFTSIVSYLKNNKVFIDKGRIAKLMSLYLLLSTITAILSLVFHEKATFIEVFMEALVYPYGMAVLYIFLAWVIAYTMTMIFSFSAKKASLEYDFIKEERLEHFAKVFDVLGAIFLFIIALEKLNCKVNIAESGQLRLVEIFSFESVFETSYNSMMEVLGLWLVFSVFLIIVILYKASKLGIVKKLLSTDPEDGLFMNLLPILFLMAIPSIAPLLWIFVGTLRNMITLWIMIKLDLILGIALIVFWVLILNKLEIYDIVVNLKRNAQKKKSSASSNERFENVKTAFFMRRKDFEAEAPEHERLFKLYFAISLASKSFLIAIFISLFFEDASTIILFSLFLMSGDFVWTETMKYSSIADCKKIRIPSFIEKKNKDNSQTNEVQQSSKNNQDGPYKITSTSIITSIFLDALTDIDGYLFIGLIGAFLFISVPEIILSNVSLLKGYILPLNYFIAFNVLMAGFIVGYGIENFENKPNAILTIIGLIALTVPIYATIVATVLTPLVQISELLTNAILLLIFTLTVVVAFHHIFSKGTSSKTQTVGAKRIIITIFFVIMSLVLIVLSLLSIFPISNKLVLAVIIIIEAVFIYFVGLSLPPIHELIHKKLDILIPQNISIFPIIYNLKEIKKFALVHVRPSTISIFKEIEPTKKNIVKQKLFTNEYDVVVLDILSYILLKNKYKDKFRYIPIAKLPTSGNSILVPYQLIEQIDSTMNLQPSAQELFNSVKDEDLSSLSPLRDIITRYLVNKDKIFVVIPSTNLESKNNYTMLERLIQYMVAKVLYASYKNLAENNADIDKSSINLDSLAQKIILVAIPPDNFIMSDYAFDLILVPDPYISLLATTKLRNVRSLVIWDSADIEQLLLSEKHDKPSEASNIITLFGLLPFHYLLIHESLFNELKSLLESNFKLNNAPLSYFAENPTYHQFKKHWFSLAFLYILQHIMNSETKFAILLNDALKTHILSELVRLRNEEGYRSINASFYAGSLLFKLLLGYRNEQKIRQIIERKNISKCSILQSIATSIFSTGTINEKQLPSSGMSFEITYSNLSRYYDVITNAIKKLVFLKLQKEPPTKYCEASESESCLLKLDPDIRKITTKSNLQKILSVVSSDSSIYKDKHTITSELLTLLENINEIFVRDKDIPMSPIELLEAVINTAWPIPAIPLEKNEKKNVLAPITEIKQLYLTVKHAYSLLQPFNPETNDKMYKELAEILQDPSTTIELTFNDLLHGAKLTETLLRKCLFLS